MWGVQELTNEQKLGERHTTTMPQGPCPNQVWKHSIKSCGLTSTSFPRWTHDRVNAHIHSPSTAQCRMQCSSCQYAAESCTWWRHQMETFSALLAICAGNSPVPGEFPTQRPVTWNLDVFFDLHLNKRLSKQWWRLWFEMPLCPLWRHCNEKHNWLSSKYAQLITYGSPWMARRMFPTLSGLPKWAFITFPAWCETQPDKWAPLYIISLLDKKHTQISEHLCISLACLMWHTAR